MNAWSHLPNAAHIDRIIQSVKSHPESWNSAWNAARSMTLGETRNAARSMTLGEIQNAARDAVRVMAWGVTRNAAWDAARDAVLALVAYDDAAKYLDMPMDQLRVWAILSEEPAAVLLLPAVVAYEKINELETV